MRLRSSRQNAEGGALLGTMLLTRGGDAATYDVNRKMGGGEPACMRTYAAGGPVRSAIFSKVAINITLGAPAVTL